VRTGTTLAHMPTQSAPQEQGTTKTVRVTLSDEDWRRLRLEAANKGMSLTRLVNLTLERESATIVMRGLRAQAPGKKGGKR
jgi:predicted HicB family RNase H-like nuclease